MGATSGGVAFRDTTVRACPAFFLVSGLASTASPPAPAGLARRTVRCHEEAVAGRLTDQLRKATRAQSDLHPVEGEALGDGGEGGGGGSSRKPFGWFALVALVVLVVGGWLVVRQLQADSNLQDCVMSGRKNCAPIDTGSVSP
jgi:hypothetical protein